AGGALPGAGRRARGGGMIGVLLRDLRWRLLLVGLMGVVFFFWELEIQSHSGEDSAVLGPAGIAATPAYFASLVMIVLLAGFISPPPPSREAWFGPLFFFPPFLPNVVDYVLGFFPVFLRQLTLFVLPPQTTALQSLYTEMLDGRVDWGAVAFSAGYAAVFLVA